jgi:DNA polymerase-3 subunit alpha
MAGSFVHLHVHTEYSMLDGAARVGDLVEAASRMGMPALAITDHGNLFGLWDFYKQATAAGITPVLGCEAYLAPGSRFDKRGEKEKYSHLTLWSTGAQGYANLTALASRASLEGYYYKPRVDRALLAEHAAGLVASTGCAGGEVSQALLRGDYATAKRTAGELAEIFGPGNFYVELMRHGIEVEERTFPDLVRLARELDLPLVATNDLHYTEQADATAHEVLLCVQTASTLADPNRFRFESQEFYLKSPDQMREVFRDLPEACDNTLAIAERVSFDWRSDGYLLPRFPVPDGHTEESWLREEVERGLRRRYGDAASEQVRAQVDYELGVILRMGFPAYFLVVADLVRYAKENGIRVGPGRGSAAGSTVSYCLGITALDPLRYGLIFERFLNPERISMPDIDMDFDERRRADMIRYATERYGEDRVAQIVTFGTLKAKQAIKDSARVLGYPYSVGDRLTKLMPSPVMGHDVSLAACFDENSERYREAGEVRAAYDSDPDAQRVLETARGLEGLKRQAGVHAAGVVICRDPLTDHIPVWRREADGAIITQFDMGTVEKLGLLKMDFLGLRTLTVLDDCLAHIAANRGETVVLEELPLDDPEAYALLCRSDSVGVFQLEGGPMRALMRSMQPNCFDDICALIALYRPGPMGVGAHLDYVERKQGRRPVLPIHRELAEPLADILDETYGVIVYQEQVLAVAQRVAGYTLGQADMLRRAMGKKDKDVLAREIVPFSEGMKARGYSAAATAKLWEVLVPFADYAFNKAHSAGYGLLSYWTAYLKARYPGEFMAAVLTSVKDAKDKPAVYLHECRRMGIKVLPPDVNESDSDFTPRGTDIRFGLSAVRNVGEAVVGSIIDTRTRRGRFTDFFDFLRKVEPAVCNKRVVESLIKAGAFDSFGRTRRGLHAVHGEAIDGCLDTKRAEALGQYDLFGTPEGDGAMVLLPDLAVPVQEWEKATLLAFEREMLGLYVSDHPLLGVEHLLAAQADCGIAALLADDVVDGSIVTVGGIISSVNRKMTKQGSAWAIALLEDLEGAVEVMFFPQTYPACATHLTEDAVVLVRGRLNRAEDVPRLVALDLIVPDLGTEVVRDRGPLELSLPATRCTAPVVEQLRAILATHPGTTEVRLRLVSPDKVTVLRLDESLKVLVGPSLSADLKALLGPGCLPPRTEPR